MRARIVLPLLLAVVGSSGVVAQDWAPKIDVRAERTQKVAPGVYQFNGNVIVATGKLTIRADSVEARSAADPKTALVIAEGNVAIERGAERLQLKRLELDLVSGRGVFELQP